MTAHSSFRMQHVCALALAFFSAGSTSDAYAATANKAVASTVAIDKFAFAPQEITVRPGTTITWTNRDQTPHALAAQDRSFASQAMDTDDSYRFTFTREGDFSYFCTLHPFMKGVVHVRK